MSKNMMVGEEVWGKGCFNCLKKRGENKDKQKTKEGEKNYHCRTE